MQNSRNEVVSCTCDAIRQGEKRPRLVFLRPFRSFLLFTLLCSADSLLQLVVAPSSPPSSLWLPSSTFKPSRHHRQQEGTRVRLTTSLGEGS
jgi:hypothetical protein